MNRGARKKRSNNKRVVERRNKDFYGMTKEVARKFKHRVYAYDPGHHEMFAGDNPFTDVYHQFAKA